MNKKIVSFTDLIVYQDSYRSSIEVMKRIVSKLPDEERYDLKDQLRRSCKAIPRLIAEGLLNNTISLVNRFISWQKAGHD